MATKRQTHGAELRQSIDAATPRFAATAAVVFLGLPTAAYLAGAPRASFYLHVALGAFWFVLGSSLDAAGDEATAAMNGRLVPRMVVAEPLSLGVVGSGVGLAHLTGYWSSPSLWPWAALGIGLLVLAIVLAMTGIRWGV